jgi:hypothetical protein
VFSIKGTDGQWYKCGFTKPKCSEGDTIEVTVKETDYGSEITDPKNITVVGGGGISVPTPSAPRSSGGGGRTGYDRVFPVPALSPERAIIRQNALTNARELYAATHGGKPFTFGETAAMNIIDVARIFEAYSTGDIDKAAAMAEVAKEGLIDA